MVFFEHNHLTHFQSMQMMLEKLKLLMVSDLCFSLYKFGQICYVFAWVAL